MIHDLIIVGAGPAGLSAAIEARRLGLRRILVLEREAEAGGAPRHCGHPGFGMLDLMRLTTGPRYAAMLRARAAGVDVLTSTAVTKLETGGVVHASAPAGPLTLEARAVIAATGIREATRAGRLVGGSRPFGVFTTTSLQRFVHLEGRLPFRRPVVVGTELVGLSALWTLRAHGVRAAALLETKASLQSSALLARPASLVFGAPLSAGCSDLTIEGRQAVTGVTYRRAGQLRRLDCDAVILTGQWRPEAALLAPPEAATGDWTLARRPIETADPALFLAGNVRYAVRSSGPAALEGRAVARLVTERLSARR